jgi:glyoxylase-like metal-dependent hydrolase (beta-lactamase superfamily II)
MTYHGTNSYLIETDDGLMILDPGPDEPAHIAALAAAGAGRATAILLSHGHYDHCAGAPRLRGMLDIPIYGYHAFAGKKADIDLPLREGDRIGGMDVLHTPGHASDHICFARSDGVVFTGDHIMGWSSSVVPFPSGSMADFITSLRRMADREDSLYLCGHGPALPDPAPFVQSLIHHRLRRESAVLQALRDGMTSSRAIAQSLYESRGIQLLEAAEHNVKAHLAKLMAEGRVQLDGDTLRPVD